MRRDDVNYLVVGLFVLLALAAFLGLMYFITGRGGPTDEYHAYYDNVTGIKYGTGVFFEGYQVGQVEAVEPEPAPAGMRYKVTLGVERGWRIPVDSVARIAASGLISQVQIEIREGDSQTLLAPGNEIRGVQQADLFATLSAAASGLNDLSQTGVAPVLANLNQRISQVAEDVLRFRRDELSPFLATLDTRVNHGLVGQAETVLTRLDASASRLQSILSAENERTIANFLTHVDDVAINLNALVQRIEGTRARMQGVLDSLDSLVDDNDDDVRATVLSARAVLGEMETTLTTVNERMDTVMYNLDGSSRQLHELTRSLRDNPARILRSAPASDAGGEP